MTDKLWDLETDHNYSFGDCGSNSHKLLFREYGLGENAK